MFHLECFDILKPRKMFLRLSFPRFDILNKHTIDEEFSSFSRFLLSIGSLSKNVKYLFDHL